MNASKIPLLSTEHTPQVDAARLLVRMMQARAEHAKQMAISQSRRK